MLFLKMFVSFDVLFALYLLIDILVPTVKCRVRFPILRWVLRKCRLLPAEPSPGDVRLDAADRRLNDALDRLMAAETEVQAAKLERKAMSVETKARRKKS